MRRIYRLSIYLLLITLIIPIKTGYSASVEQINEVDLKVQELIQTMTPEEKVGQLFLVTFQGREVTESSEIFDLIANRHVGGVVLNLANDNFTSLRTVESAYQLIKTLQEIEWESSFTSELEGGESDTSQPLNYIPIFTAISQEGDSYPYNSIINGVTTLPSQLAIGATWDLTLAEGVGNVLGQELSALGFNLLLGPSLDVLDLPYVEGGDDLGARTFGGDPFWVGELGKAYIKGVHSGSNNRMAVISKHFPGRGSSDRLPENEVATVRKSLEQLKQIELAPFFSVTGNSHNEESTTDGLLMSHIRYQGFQGNIRSTTRPVSFDQTAQEQLMSLPAFESWRNSGGIIVSDNLGSSAVRKFFNPTGEGFDPRQISRNALISGNDLLLLDLYVDTSDLDPYSTMLRVLEFFTQKYLEDPAFAQRVDSSVRRILKLKFELYEDFDIENIIPDIDGLDKVGKNQEINFDIASHSVVLMSPDLVELSAILPEPPQSNERMLFITDTISARQCTDCPPQSIFGVTTFQEAVLRLYGPGAGDQVIPSRMSSYTFADLNRYLNDPQTSLNLDSELRNSDWIVFSFIKPKFENQDSMALQRFLADRPDLINNKKVIAFGFNAPYYLDATDISKLTAYFVLFSKTTEFIDTAARLLFQEISADGVLPVSVPGIGYDLISRTAPNPNQLIPLFMRTPEEISPAEGDTSPDFSNIPKVDLGETISLETGVIVDYNMNPVPDGTIVRFLFSYIEKGSNVQQVEAITQKGVAMVSYRLQNTGLVEIRVVSDPAYNSEVIQLEVPVPEGAEATIVVLSTPEMTETPTPTLTPTVAPTEPVVEIMENPPLLPRFRDWIAMVIIVSSMSAGLFFFSRKRVPIRWRTRWAILAFMGGMLAYVLISFQTILRFEWTLSLNPIDLMAVSILGGVVGWFVGWIWYIRGRMDLRKS
ncbi:MAG: glycoside hydrolase family 3 N-terminal domain-containing protein [Anaerolineaceae bacterium]|jgi:beta-N-acetylhexosaminidase|nr:glycoside hydrolase family 3 N-terminal domain-containing protein [Anaerolineaceae bacterium]